MSTCPEARPRGAHLTVLDRVHLAPPQTSRSLTIWPLVREVLASRQVLAPQPVGSRIGSRISTLSQALEDGFVSVDDGSETGERGSVSDVRIGNRACDPVLIIFSEELHAESGALIADASVLLPPTSELKIGVHPAGEVTDGDALRCGFSRVERQIGFVAAIGGEVVGLEVMSDAEVFARSFETLLRPYALDTVAADAARGRADVVLDPLFDAPEPFLAALEKSHVVASPTAGLGRGLRLAGPGLAGCALEAGEIVHLAAFPLEVAWAA